MKHLDGVTGGKAAASQEAGVVLGSAEDEIGRVRLPAQAIPSRSLAEMLPEALRSIEAMEREKLPECRRASRSWTG